jgi:hypothetical protein
MRRVAGYVHAAGHHCGSTSISRLLAFHGHAVSEAMCLGLSAGVDFGYLVATGMSPSRYVMGRGPTLEIDGLASLGVECTIRDTDDPAEGWAWVKNEIDAGRPAMIQVDIRWLDYYQTQTHFGGHKIIVFGYDEARQVALVSDNQFAEPQELPLAGLAKARAQTELPFFLHHDWFDVRVPEHLTPLDEAVPRAIRTLAARMLGDRGPMWGVAAMSNLAADLPNWSAAPDWRWCARFGYQMLERRGTGGGNFRRVYAEFLREAAPHCADIARLGLAEQIQTIADHWTTLAYRLREISELPSPDGFNDAAAQVSELTGLERTYYKTVLGGAEAGRG